jgi:hypothetical protein
LISRQEHEAWDMLLACQGQLRLAPSWHVTRIDMDVALSLADARSCDLVALSELLPAAEMGMVEALCSDQVRDDGPLDQAPAMSADCLFPAIPTHVGHFRL